MSAPFDAGGVRLPELPTLPVATGAFEPFVRVGTLVYLSGQINILEGRVTATGRVPGQVSVLQARAAARVCGLNLLSALVHACENELGRVERCVQVRGFVNAQEGFEDVPRVVDGASELFLEVFGEAGRHARTSIGVSTLPLGAAVEIDAVFALRS